MQQEISDLIPHSRLNFPSELFYVFAAHYFFLIYFLATVKYHL